MNFRRTFRAIARLDSWLGRKRNPLLNDAEYRGLYELRRRAIRRHAPVRHIDLALRHRVNQLLGGV